MTLEECYNDALGRLSQGERELDRIKSCAAAEREANEWRVRVNELNAENAALRDALEEALVTLERYVCYGWCETGKALHMGRAALAAGEAKP